MYRSAWVPLAVVEEVGDGMSRCLGSEIECWWSLTAEVKIADVVVRS